MAYSAAMKHAIGAVRAALCQYGLERQGDQFSRHGHHEPAPNAPLVLVACSGGRDSLALAAVAHIVCGAWGLRCGAVLIDHAMQQGSAQVSAHAAGQCRALGLAPVIVHQVQVRSAGTGAEAAARDARYAAIIQAAREFHAAVVLLAHTKNDQAESVVIDLIRSAGTDAMAGMAPTMKRGGVQFLRPLLDVTRDETTAICRDLELEYWDDPTNGDAVPADEPLPRSYPLRSRVRHTLLPELSRFAGCDMVERLASGATVARRDIAFLDMQADEWVKRTVTFVNSERPHAPESGTAHAEHAGARHAQQGNESTSEHAGAGEHSDTGDTEVVLARIDAAALAQAPEAMRFRALARTLAACGIPYSAKRLTALERLVSAWHGQQPVKLGGPYTARRFALVIRLCKDKGHANRRRAGHH